MFRRLNFLLPNEITARKVAKELTDLGVNNKNIHTYAEQALPAGLLNPVAKHQIQHKALKLENMLWNANLIIFFAFLIILLSTLVTGQYLLALLSTGMMTFSFMLGNFFTTHIPNTHFDQFKHAVSHNELLMMVDLPNEKVADIEDKIHRHHPAIVEGGSSWTLKGVDI